MRRSVLRQWLALADCRMDVDLTGWKINDDDRGGDEPTIETAYETIASISLGDPPAYFRCKSFGSPRE
jgi:hypothetical protein